MKKLLSLLVVFFVAAALVSCGGGTVDGGDNKEQIEIVEIVDFDSTTPVEVTFCYGSKKPRNHCWNHC